ncbi:hypothetical protein BBBOND_0202260 [Babesia bigemina]|uniref:Uncharacterized protein n=1 Tax=Babesia bigemina TaxID=5866 RepID=A0A061D815_BABBI|nr:hypothetical protein BBBOND_0202260 [Babesia bigemina]CDR95069.1 hypothetical protein BBBOND_0202260 [Babesia bigemina]|eukprot:XP_012767255.1 hypothetical protein BBBOND_0202260 [Babesia bigemina]
MTPHIYQHIRHGSAHLVARTKSKLMYEPLFHLGSESDVDMDYLQIQCIVITGWGGQTVHHPH